VSKLPCKFVLFDCPECDMVDATVRVKRDGSFKCPICKTEYNIADCEGI
jgi:uncharacterized paraquat-inducible protein A